MLQQLILIVIGWLSALVPEVLCQTDSTSQISTRSTRVHTSLTFITPTFAGGLPVQTVETTVSAPSGSYQSSLTTRTFSTATLSHNSTGNSIYIVGTVHSNSTATHGTGTTTSPSTTNTQICNGYVEYCTRKYMNITEVCAHNSAFAVRNNAASNQDIDIIGQLNDGIRMIQGETHLVNGSMYSCHSTCNLLNAGTLEDELTTVREWVEEHPYDVITILLVNSDFVDVDEYVAPIVNSGLRRYLYEPPKQPMNRTDWPTLSNMILLGKRAVVFLDYNANQTKVPYILDEFSQMWETPFSPTDEAFPCDEQRPPNLTPGSAKSLPYLANHNLNIAVDLGNMEPILIPNFDQLNQTNSVAGLKGNGPTGSLGLMANNCVAMWDYAPAFLLVDYYNYGNFPGSVFEVAAQLNNVTYSGKCCGANLAISHSNSLLPGFRLPVLATILVAIVTYSLVAFR